MATSTETAVYTAEFIASEANGTRSRETGTVLSGEVLSAGEIVQKNADDKWISVVGALDSDGLGGFDVGVSFRAVDATAGDVTGAVFITRDAELVDALLTYPDAGSDATEVAAVKAALRDQGIRTL